MVHGMAITSQDESSVGWEGTRSVSELSSESENITYFVL